MRIFVNMSDNGNLVISHMIHRALPDTYLKIKPYQDFKHREKSKVNLPRTQKVGAEKGDSEPTGSPGTLTPNAHRHTPRDHALRDAPWIYTGKQDVASVKPAVQWLPARRGRGERQQSVLSAGSSRGYVSCVLLRCQDRGGEKNRLSALKSPSPFFHG